MSARTASSCSTRTNAARRYASTCGSMPTARSGRARRTTWRIESSAVIAREGTGSRYLEPLEAKAFLTADAIFTQVHDSEPLIMHVSDFGCFGRRKSIGVGV